MAKEAEVEVLDPLSASEIEIHDNLAVLTKAAETALRWADDVEITNAVTLQDAVQVGKDCRSVEQKIEVRRKELVDPLNKRVKFINATAKDILAPFQAAMDKVKEKIEVYNIRKEAEAKQREESARAEREAIEKKARAEAEERRRQEEAAQAAEVKRLAELKAQQDAEAKKVKDAQQRELLRIRQEEERKAEAERIVKERAEREEQERKRKAEEDKQLAIRQAQLRNEETKAAGAQKTRNVAKVWTYRIVNEHEVPRNYCVPSAQLIRSAVNAGAREIPGVEIYEDVQARLG